MRHVGMLRCLLLCTPLLPGAMGLACAEDDERYASLNFSYSFGGPDRHANSAALSFGTLETSADPLNKLSVMHLPLVQVPLAEGGPAYLAPVRLVGTIVQLLREQPSRIALDLHRR